MPVWEHCENPRYVWQETSHFLDWLAEQGACICHDMRRYRGRWQALLDGHGWFAPQWRDMPDEVTASCNPVPRGQQP